MKLWRERFLVRRNHERALRRWTSECGGSKDAVLGVREAILVGAVAGVRSALVCGRLRLIVTGVVMVRGELISSVALVVLGLRSGQEVCGERVRADLKTERPIGGGHEAHRNERTNDHRHQQYADDPLVCATAENPASHSPAICSGERECSSASWPFDSGGHVRDSYG